jgi:hypothetical protein
MTESDAPSYLIVIERADDGGYGAWAPDRTLRSPTGRRPS